MTVEDALPMMQSFVVSLFALVRSMELDSHSFVSGKKTQNFVTVEVALPMIQSFVVCS